MAPPDAILGACSRARALLFDLDGTLADTMPLHLSAWQRVLAERGVVLERERYYALAGVPTRTILKTLSVETGVPLDFDELVIRKESYFLDQAAGMRPIEPWFSLARDHAGKKPIAIVSGGIRRSVHRTLDLIGARPFFEVVVTAEDTEHGKPDPAPFLLAADRLGIAPDSCIVFEDGDPGIVAAAAARMAVVDVRTGALVAREGR